MKRMSIMTLLIASAGIAMSAHAADWIYTSASVGYAAGDNKANSSVKLEKNYDWNLAVGKKIQDWRFEGSVGYFKAKDKVAGNLDSQVMTYMANAYYDLPITDNKDFVPHIGVGVGAADYASAYTRFAMQGTAGVSYRLDNHMWLNADYRYLEAQKRTVPGSSADQYKANSFNVGLSYAFS